MRTLTNYVQPFAHCACVRCPISSLLRNILGAVFPCSLSRPLHPSSLFFSSLEHLLTRRSFALFSLRHRHGELSWTSPICHPSTDSTPRKLPCALSTTTSRSRSRRPLSEPSPALVRYPHIKPAVSIPHTDSSAFCLIVAVVPFALIVCACLPCQSLQVPRYFD